MECGEPSTARREREQTAGRKKGQEFPRFQANKQCKDSEVWKKPFPSCACAEGPWMEGVRWEMGWQGIAVIPKRSCEGTEVLLALCGAVWSRPGGRNRNISKHSHCLPGSGPVSFPAVSHQGMDLGPKNPCAALGFWLLLLCLVVLWALGPPWLCFCFLSSEHPQTSSAALGAQRGVLGAPWAGFYPLKAP